MPWGIVALVVIVVSIVLILLLHPDPNWNLFK